MKERPILFSSPMVRAILEGRKSQTRRRMKLQPDDDAVIDIGEIGTSTGVAYIGNSTSGGLRTRVPCPYGQPGDLLWVRETWGLLFADGGEQPTFYRADYTDADLDGDFDWFKWKPSILMPRWASRLTLRITGVRVERLQEISEADAEAEGTNPIIDRVPTHRDSYRYLWDSINGAGSWELNPWVWVIEFERIKQQARAA